MSRISILLLVFALAFAVFFMGPAFLGSAFDLYPLMKWGDALDLLTPLALLPLYWLILASQQGRELRRPITLAFLLLAGLWVEGQGMHLAGNSIGHLLEDQKGTAVFQLTYFYDEVLSHYLWHAGVLGMAALWVAGHWDNRMSMSGGDWAGVTVASVIHGFLLFTILIEGQTWPMMLPSAVVLSAILLVWGRQGRLRQPVLAFVLISCVVALLFTLGWGLYWGELPEFSQVGII
jgi:hypothetical protein